jgi:hypothetical protein
MSIKERLLNALDGLLLAVVMAWTVTIAAALLYPSTGAVRSSAQLQASIVSPAASP